MKTLTKALSIALIVLTKFTSISKANEITEVQNSELQQEQGDALFQELMEKVSPNDFREVNQRDPDISFES